MRVGQIVDAKFKTAVGKLLPQDMPIKTTLVLKGVVDLLNSEIEKYEKSRQELLSKYGSKDEAGKLSVNENGHVKFAEDSAESYIKEYNTLCSAEVNIPTLSVQELGDKVTLSHDDLVTLAGFLTN